MNATLIKHNMEKMFIIMTQIDTIDKLSMRITTRRQHMTKYWSDSLNPQWSRQAVVMISLSTWMTTKMNGVVTDLFCTGVIGHPEYNFLN